MCPVISTLWAKADGRSTNQVSAERGIILIFLYISLYPWLNFRADLLVHTIYRLVGIGKAVKVASGRFNANAGTLRDFPDFAGARE
jgi:hypothetical protein